MNEQMYKTMDSLDTSFIYTYLDSMYVNMYFIFTGTLEFCLKSQ